MIFILSGMCVILISELGAECPNLGHYYPKRTLLLRKKNTFANSHGFEIVSSFES